MIPKDSKTIRDADLYDPTPLRRAKLIQGLRVTQIAAMVGASPSTVSKILSGRSGPNARKLPAIAKALGVDMADCFPETVTT